ncbi:cysteine-rich repeat secretory protein 38-like [Prosopis cineraria]|uniref:cysteine-rich repeat secretory protein 38-like n=1 Tax=Prosopis cineraria TaxID=364024 RepID=UPI00240FEC3F|nr:cysteine-rich repeat secretory protein 38-like [Prosopis cineraria]
MSSSNKLISSAVLLLTWVLLLRTSLGADPLSYVCSNPQNFTANTPFGSNLKTLITILTYKTPLTGFGLASIGQNKNQKAYGLSLCRGDVSPSDCETCVSEAVTGLLKRCSYNKGAIIWYDNCLFKYSDQDFFGRIDNANKLYLFNVQNVSDPDAFNYKTKELLSRLAEEAHANPNMYAAGEANLGESKNMTVYGLTQCTRDLSIEDCKKCLDDAIGELPNCCDGKQGGRVVGGSCNVRYEIYPFFKL